MNRPTPDPSKKGTKHSSASCPFPSWEGLGVGSWSQCTASRSRGLSMNRPKGHRIAACLGKAALKTHALQTLPRGPLTRPRARSVWSASDLSALFVQRGTASRSWSQCTVVGPRRLSMNRPFGVPGFSPSGPPEGGTPNKWRPTDRFMVLTRARKRKYVPHEPGAPSSSSARCGVPRMRRPGDRRSKPAVLGPNAYEETKVVFPGNRVYLRACELSNRDNIGDAT